MVAKGATIACYCYSTLDRRIGAECAKVESVLARGWCAVQPVLGESGAARQIL